LQLEDDGTDIFFRCSAHGDNFVDLYTVAKASGFLGSGGYSNVFFGVASNNPTAIGTLMSWDES
jgi:hypothetical protein